MIVGILGLGLIGGSMARAYAVEGHTVLAAEKDENMLSFAMLTGAVHGKLEDSNIGSCDLILLAIYPDGSATWLEEHAHLVNPSSVVIDCCGIKTQICRRCFPLAEKYGFLFVGGHPMAGSQFSGFKYSRATLFNNSPMVLVPPRYDDIDMLDRVKELLKPCHFGSFSVTTAKDHDELIAFTSQMPHIISNAFVKSPTARNHKGFSAGSYKDMTRVAWLNSQMWAELCMENRENTTKELKIYIESLQEYLTALENGDMNELQRLLEDGKIRKEEIDG